MGNTACRPHDAEAKRNREIDRQLRQEYASLQSRRLRVVLLGTGASGKSTVLKQTKLLAQSFSEEERRAYVTPIHSNVISTIQRIATFLHDHQREAYTPELADLVRPVAQLDLSTRLSQAQGERIATIWAHEAVQQALSSRAKFQMQDNAPFFMLHIARLCDPAYLPTQEDLLKCRVRTSGIVRLETTFHGVNFEFVDVGGQRGERRKWMHVLDSVTAVLFVTAVSEYDVMLAEDLGQNRMRESLLVFEQIATHLPKTPIILFLNKLDLLEEKFGERESPLSDHFDSYEGGWDVDEALRYFQKQFAVLDKSDGRHLFVHVTSAVDPQLMERVMGSVQDSVITTMLHTGAVV